MSAVTDPSEGEKATSLRRGLDLLVALASEESLRADGLGVTQLAEIVGADKSRVSRTLRTLAEYDLVERDPDTLAYRFGWRLYAMAELVGEARLLRAAPAVLERLVHEFDEGAHLSVLIPAGVLCVLSRVPSRGLGAVGTVGRLVPPWCTASGRALLLDHDRAALGRLFGEGDLPPGGPNAARTVDALEERILGARMAGVAVVDEESEPGLMAAAAPVRDYRGRIVAALSLSAPRFRFEGLMEGAAPRVRELAAELSLAVGRRAGPAAPSRRAGPHRTGAHEP